MTFALVAINPHVLHPTSLLALSMGVYLRDLGQTIITTELMFLSPVSYLVTAVPERFRAFIMFNPLTSFIEQTREVLIWGHLPNWAGLGIYTLAATIIGWACYALFQKKPEKALPMSSNEFAIVI